MTSRSSEAGADGTGRARVASQRGSAEQGDRVGTSGLQAGGSNGASWRTVTGIHTSIVSGHPDPMSVSTSLVERHNLTIRMRVRRFTRLTNGHSKKLENHEHALALFVFDYNFARIHQSLRVTPAMEAGITNRLWIISELADLIEEAFPLPGPRGPYRKRQVQK